MQVGVDSHGRSICLGRAQWSAWDAQEQAVAFRQAGGVSGLGQELRRDALVQTVITSC